MIKYKINGYGERIERVKVISETKCFVTYEYTNWHDKKSTRRESNESYFNTWEEAKDSLLHTAQGRLDRARVNLQRAQNEYGNIKGMKKPIEGER